MLRHLSPFAFALLACDQGSGSLRGDWLEASDCKALGETQRFEPFAMSLAYAAVSERLGAGLVRMSPSARAIRFGDQLVITLDRSLDVRADIAANGSATYPLRGDGQGAADLSVALLGRCAHSTQPLSAEGSVTFYDYGWKANSRLHGEVRFDLVDRRTGAVAGKNFVGDFDFDGLTTSALSPFAPKDY